MPHGLVYLSSKLQKEICFELITHFIADTDTVSLQAEIILELVFRSRCRHNGSLQFKGAAWQITLLSDILYFIADTDTEKYNFQMLSAMNLDKR